MRLVVDLQGEELQSGDQHGDVVQPECSTELRLRAATELHRQMKAASLRVAPIAEHGCHANHRDRLLGSAREERQLPRLVSIAQ